MRYKLNVDEQTILDYKLSANSTKEQIIYELSSSSQLSENPEIRNTIAELLIKLKPLSIDEIRKIDVSDSLREADEVEENDPVFIFKEDPKGVEELLKMAKKHAKLWNDKIALKRKPTAETQSKNEHSR